jgi:FAD dependent oxidoreductase TIGR03364
MPGGNAALSKDSFDVAIVGAGIVGLAHALAAARLGLRVVVIDREMQATGASIRNFGFITVTGQEQGDVWRRARRSRDVWLEVSGLAGIPIEQRGLALVAQRPEARAVCEAFLRTEMAVDCAWLDRAEASALLDGMRPARLEGVLWSSVDLRVESRTAIPALTAWLADRHKVAFRFGQSAQRVEPGRIDTFEGPIRAAAIVVCPGDDLTTLFPESFNDAGVTRCKLQMLRLESPGYRLPGTIMSDLSLIRYLGYSFLPQAASLKGRLQSEQDEHLANGIHLIVAQSADGSLIVGDSHHYARSPDPFTHDHVDSLILEEFGAVFGSVPAVLERWVGTYASTDRHSLVAAPAPGLRLVTVTSGTGASTAFALAEEVVGELARNELGVAA